MPPHRCLWTCTVAAQIFRVSTVGHVRVARVSVLMDISHPTVLFVKVKKSSLRHVSTAFCSFVSTAARTRAPFAELACREGDVLLRFVLHMQYGHLEFLFGLEVFLLLLESWLCRDVPLKACMPWDVMFLLRLCLEPQRFFRCFWFQKRPDSLFYYFIILKK